jgi:hypothetical protein
MAPDKVLQVDRGQPSVFHEATGLHVTAGEADAWLARLEDGEDVETPECHG